MGTQSWKVVGANTNVGWKTVNEQVVAPTDATLGGVFDNINLQPLLADDTEFYFGGDKDFGLGYKSSLNKLVFEDLSGKNLMSLTSTGTLDLISQTELPSANITGDDGATYGSMAFHSGALFVLVEDV